MLKEDYVSFEVAKLLKEKGFDEPCRSYFISDLGDYRRCAVDITSKNCSSEQILMPTHQMARRWLREVHNVFIEVCLCWSENPREFPPQYYALILDTKTGNSLVKISDCKDGLNPIADKCAFPKYFTKYDEAVEKALEYSLEKLI